MSPLIAQGERGHRGPPIIFRTRFTASHAGFFIFNQSLERPERYGESLRFETMPSSPILHACWKTSKQAMAVFSSQANSLAVDDARSRAQARHGLYDERELAGQVVALIGADSEVLSQSPEQIAEVSAEPPEYLLLRSPDLGPRSSAAEDS